MYSFDLDEKCAVVIGGTSGIGRVLALGLAQAGANVVATSRSLEATEAITAEIKGLGRQSLSHPVNVRDRASITSLRDAVLDQFSEVDILVNSAGVTQRIPTVDCPDEVWDRILDVNLGGTLRACQIFGGPMIRRGKGRIINIASLASFVAFQEVAAYGASKAAVASLTRSLAVEWAPHGVYVNAIAPGIFPTSLNSAILDSPRGLELELRTPMHRFGRAEELVSAALYLASDRSSFTTGQILAVDGGFLASGVNQ